MKPINIVRSKQHRELLAANTAPAAPPLLTYRGGPLLSRVEVVTVYWGSQWSGPQDNLPGSIAFALDQFFNEILSSPLIDQLAEYSVPSFFIIGHGVHLGSVGIGGTQLDGTTVLDPDPPATVDDTAIRTALEGWIANGRVFVTPSSNTLFFIFLPQGVTVTMGGAASCQQFCGYHDTINGVYYAVVPYPDCQGCEVAADILSSLTTVASHELCEAITDPVPGQGWYDDNFGEIGDICEGGNKTIGQWTVQKEWSNAQGACV